MPLDERKIGIENVLPNFLIVGAAKAGTTSLYHYMKSHNDVFFPEVKEPKYFSSRICKYPFKGVGDDLVEKNIFKSFSEYKRLYENSYSLSWRGDASADNLYYSYAVIPFIQAWLGINIKIIMILRNPVDRAFSSYLHLIRDNREFLSFEESLKNEEFRIRNNWEFIWHYKAVGLYYNQVKSYMKNFSNIKIYLFEELQNCPDQVIKSFCDFLEIDSNYCPEIQKKHNVSGVPKIQLLNTFFQKENYLKFAIKLILRKLTTQKQRDSIKYYLINNNLRKPPMHPKTREYLKKYFREDLLKLQDLINRDLTHWIE